MNLQDRIERDSRNAARLTAWMSISCPCRAPGFSGLLTYDTALMIAAFDAADGVLEPVNSLFINNAK